MELATREKLIQKLMTGVIDQVIHGIANEETMKAKIVRKQMLAIENARKLKEEQVRLENEKKLKRIEQEKNIAKELVLKVEKEISENALRMIIDDEIRRERRERERKMAHEIVGKFWRVVLKSVDNHVKSICIEMVNEKETISEGLEIFRERVSRQWLLQFWNRWRDWVQMKKAAKLKRIEMIRRCVPRWESEGISSQFFSSIKFRF